MVRMTHGLITAKDLTDAYLLGRTHGVDYACRLYAAALGWPTTHGLNPITAGYEGACAVVKPKSPKPNTPGEA